MTVSNNDLALPLSGGEAEVIIVSQKQFNIQII